MAEQQSLDFNDDAEEFMTIIHLLNDSELAILHEALQLENERA